MHDDRQTDAYRVPRTAHVGVLGDKPRIDPAQECQGRLRVVRVSMHLERRAGMDGGLGDAGRLDVPGRVRAAFRGLPEGRTGEVGVLADGRIEHDARHLAVRPLGPEERAQLLLGPSLVVPRAADGDERRIPVPLVRIQRARRQRRGPEPARIEYGARLGLKTCQKTVRCGTRVRGHRKAPHIDRTWTADIIAPGMPSRRQRQQPTGASVQPAARG